MSLATKGYLRPVATPDKTVDDGRRWATGALNSKEYFEKVYREERAKADKDVSHALRLGRRRQPSRHAGA